MIFSLADLVGVLKLLWNHGVAQRKGQEKVPDFLRLLLPTWAVPLQVLQSNFVADNILGSILVIDNAIDTW